MTPEELIRELCKVMGLDVEGYRVGVDAESGPYVEALARGCTELQARPAEPPRYITVPLKASSYYLVEGLPRATPVVVPGRRWSLLLDCVRPANTVVELAPEWLPVVRLHLVELYHTGLYRGWELASLSVYVDVSAREALASMSRRWLSGDVRLEELPPCMQAAIMLSR